MSPTEDPERNFQILSYAAGALNDPRFKDQVDGVDLAMIQPRAYRPDDKFRAGTLSIAAVREAAKVIVTGVRLARSPNAQRVPARPPGNGVPA